MVVFPGEVVLPGLVPVLGFVPGRVGAGRLGVVVGLVLPQALNNSAAVISIEKYLILIQVLDRKSTGNTILLPRIRNRIYTYFF